MVRSLGGEWFLWDKDALQVQQKAHPNSIAVLGDDSRFKAREKIMTRQTAHGIIATLDTARNTHPILLTPRG
jgi:hypothetical protein